MTPMQWLLDETGKWLVHARRELRAAELCSVELPAEALYHCQQAAEKFLKGLLTYHQTAFRKTYGLRELALECAAIDPSIEVEIQAATTALTRYAWLFRYPGAPYEPDAVEVAEGVKLAVGIGAVRRRLPMSSGFV